MTQSTTHPVPMHDAETDADASENERASVAARGAPGRDRRRHQRLGHDAVPGIGAITLYPRDPAELLNISSTGLLVSCSRRLMPDAPAKFVLQGNDAEDLVVTGRVVRSKLVAVGGGIAYETAICADTEMDLEKYGATLPPPPNTRQADEPVPGPFEGTCVTPNGEMAIKVSGLSDRGCFIAQPNTVAPGDQLNLEIHVPGGVPIASAAEVVSADATTGFAVVFLEADQPESALPPSTLDPAPLADARLTGATLASHDAHPRTETPVNDW